MDSLSYIFQGGPLLASAVFALAFGLAIFAKVFGDDAVAKLPFLGKEFGKTEEQRRKVYLAKAVEVYKQGEKMFKDKAYRLTTQNGMRVVVPNSALDELRQFPESIINHSIVKDNVAEAKYTGLRGDFELFNNIIRKDLTRSLTRLNSRLVEEVATTVDDEFGPCEEWTTVPLYPKSIRIVATVAASIFVGPELCRNPQYLGTVIRFTGDLFGAVRSLRRWNPWLRPIGQYFVPELKTLATHRENIKKVMMPIIQERKAAAKRGDEVPDDMLQWMITKAEERGMADEELARFELSLAMAANHTTSITLLDVLSELAIRPDVIEELRAEIESVVDAKDGALTANSLFNMKLLDSVMRETQRMNPINECRLNSLSPGPHACYKNEKLFFLL
ncbi:cytochrome P450, partial [Xylariales sp. PMI_506]